MFYVYVLRSDSDAGFYIGFSTDLKRRLAEHRRGASFATKSRGLWKLIYYEAYTEREDAEGREKFLKSGPGGVFCEPNCVTTSSDSLFRHPNQPREPKAFYVAMLIFSTASATATSGPPNSRRIRSLARRRAVGSRGQMVQML
jgi:putative endonuclease